MPQHYDYVIVGGGSAGCVLANRLSEDPTCKVALLEAGGSAASPLVTRSLGFAMVQGKPKYDWCFELGPEPGLNGRRRSYPRGRVLGGSSSINAMLYVRGLRRDYDSWAEEGLPDWGWDAVEPYLRRLEDFQAASPHRRGVGGPTKVSPTPNMHPLSERIIVAAGQASLGATADYNGAEPSGLGQSQIFYRKGRRSGSAAAYLQPVAKRPNLHVVTGALVERLQFEDRRVRGVHYRTNSGADCTVTAEEVILSAGAIGSPHLLEISGIGDAARLQRLGIEPRHHLPCVGEQMQDHCMVSVVQTLKNLEGLGREFSGARALRNAASYLLWGRGPFDGTFVQVAGHGAVQVEGQAVDLQFTCVPLRIDFIKDQKTVKMASEPAATLTVNVCRPRSRGHVHAISGSLNDKPEIVANLLTDPLDLKASIAGLRRCREILQQPAFDGFLVEELKPGAAKQDEASLEDYVRSTGETAYHPVGTCRMSVSAQNGVVDQSLKVHGLSGLRIIDASIMPALVSANTHAPTVMIAEKAADILKREGRP